MSYHYKYPKGARHVSAIYSTGLGPYDDNPLIAALQPSWEAEQIVASTTWWPEHDELHHSLPAAARAEMAMQLQDGFETLPQHVTILTAILSAMRRCYFGRAAFVHGNTAEIIARAVEPEAHRRYGVRISGTSNSLLIHGLPGMGKSSLMLRLSALLPQIIDHTEFKGRPWPCRQVTYLRVAAQQNWTDKALAQAILEEFDRVAGTNYTAELNRRGTVSSYTYLLKFNLAANNHGLGMLILDEVQLLKSNTTLLNFVLNFSTTNNVLLVLVGTPASVDVMRDDPRFMRRGDSLFDPELKRFGFPKVTESEYDAMLQNAEAQVDDWTWFLQAFWPLQYNTVFTPLTYKLSARLHYLSAGITHYAVNIFIAAQLMRISTSKDHLDEDALKEAYTVCCTTSKEYLEDLRMGRWNSLKKYGDFAQISHREIAEQAAAARRAKAEQDVKDKLAQARQEKAKREKDAQQPRTKEEPKPTPEPVAASDLPRADKDELL